MLEILDKNGNRRGYAKSDDAAEVIIKQLEKERPNMAPFSTSKAEAPSTKKPAKSSE